VGRALITGASRGIGLALTEVLARRGWEVVATCRDPVGAEKLQALAASLPVRIEPLDVGDFDAIDALASRFDGPLDLLVNNAGVSGRTKLGEIDYALWEKVLRTNLLAPMKMVEAFLPRLKASGAPRVVSLASSMGSINGTTGGSYIYRSSKAAMHMAMRSLALDLRDSGIIVALISPGFVDTDFTRAARAPKISVDESANGLAHAIERLGPEDNGRLFRFNGEAIAF
jgi:NAD(P)-dependent dehydrogenase (short-subunit alcohol dehydrogenase family)